MATAAAEENLSSSSDGEEEEVRGEGGGGGAEKSLNQPLLNSRSFALQRDAPNNTSQVAVVGSNICPIESLDYELVENDIFSQD